MIWAILRFEIRKRTRRLSTYIYFALFFAIAFLFFLGAGGAFGDQGLSMAGSEREWVNAPRALHLTITILSLYLVIIVAALSGQSVYQDFHHGIAPLFFTKPVSELQYLCGRFLGGFAILILISTAIGLGAWLASLTPFVDASAFGPNRWQAYARPFGFTVLPNLFLVGSFFFCLATLTRKIFPVYAGAVVLLIGYLIAQQLIADLEHETLAAMVDPFGLTTLLQQTKYWSVLEKNEQLIPLSGALLANRILWITVGFALLGLTYFRFSFSHDGSGARTGNRPPKTSDQTPSITRPNPVARGFGPGFRVRSFVTLVRIEFGETVQNIYFAVIILCGMLFMLIAGMSLDSFYGTPTYPVTYMVLETAGGSFGLFSLIILTFFAGEMVWRERDRGMDELMNVLPASNATRQAAKLSALALIQILLAITICLCGVGLQAARGYYRFELDQYFFRLFVIDLPSYLLLCVLAVAVHVFVNHKFLGHFIMVAYYLAMIGADQMGFEHDLFKLFSPPEVVYSDMNGYGQFLKPFFWYAALWSVLALILAFAANLFWVRGKEAGLRQRLRQARLRFNTHRRRPVALAVALFLAIGSFIFYNANILNTYRTSSEERRLIAEYEKKYKIHEDSPQPRITAVRLEVDIFPEKRHVLTRGQYTLTNRSGQTIDRIMVNISDLAAFELSLDPPAQIELGDDRLGFYIFKLEQAMAPDATATLTFQSAFEPEGFGGNNALVQVVQNGSFFGQTLFQPSIGYQTTAELTSDRARKKFGLPPKPGMASIDDLPARQNNYIANDADRLEFEAIVSTSSDQVPLAPGYLQREWTENGRRYAHYKKDRTILNIYGFLSARYAVVKDHWNDIAIEIQHHPTHTYNLAAMTEAIKDSLDYYSAAFGPYQHRQIRIAAFPRYASFAQALPNIIPYSESIGFIARVNPDDDRDINYPYYVTAHEVAHQWWAHQVVGADVQGATFLSETLSQYAALMVMKRKYGETQMKRFLRYELDSYLVGRGQESKRELPLIRNENQPYIHYRKGSLIMYALQDYLGEALINQVMREIIDKYAFKGPPYPTAKVFVDLLKASTPESAHLMIGDFLERVVVYDLRMVEAITEPESETGYKVTLQVKAIKNYLDEPEHAIDQALQMQVDIGLFNADGAPIYLEKHKLTDIDQTLSIHVAERPARAGIDPYFKLIDRQPNDNLIPIKHQ